RGLVLMRAFRDTFAAAGSGRGNEEDMDLLHELRLTKGRKSEGRLRRDNRIAEVGYPRGAWASATLHRHAQGGVLNSRVFRSGDYTRSVFQRSRAIIRLAKLPAFCMAQPLLKRGASNLRRSTWLHFVLRHPSPWPSSSAPAARPRRRR